MNADLPKHSRGRKILWGIYHPSHMSGSGDEVPPRTVIEATSQLAAEETAARLGFGDPRAIPVTPAIAASAEWLPNRRTGHRQDLARFNRQETRRGKGLA